MVEQDSGYWHERWQLLVQLFSQGRTAYVGLALVVILCGSILIGFFMTGNQKSPSLAVNWLVIPNSGLTPGSTRSATLNDICLMSHEQVVQEVPLALRRAVLEEYGITTARPEDYEIDFLIAPGLGGAPDIKNLWPEPYSPSTWNARDKDALEEHLHQMVCSDKLDLKTAQNDIAKDWIAAYKKYFHTDSPRHSLRSRIMRANCRA